MYKSLICVTECNIDFVFLFLDRTLIKLIKIKIGK